MWAVQDTNSLAVARAVLGLARSGQPEQMQDEGGGVGSHKGRNGQLKGIKNHASVPQSRGKGGRGTAGAAGKRAAGWGGPAAAASVAAVQRA